MPRSYIPFDLVRIRVTPDQPDEGPPAIDGYRPRGSRRPHIDLVVAKVRHLIEHTPLTYSQIAAKTGVGRASICRWARDGAWQRPIDAPRATDHVPTVRAGQRLKLRKLAERLRLLAERYVRDLEERPDVDLDKLMQALQVLKMARLEAQGRRRRRRDWYGPAMTGREYIDREESLRRALREMHRGGVDVDRIPQEAMDLLENAKKPAEEHPWMRDRTPKRRRKQWW